MDWFHWSNFPVPTQREDSKWAQKEGGLEKADGIKKKKIEGIVLCVGNLEERGVSWFPL